MGGFNVVKYQKRFLPSGKLPQNYADRIKKCPHIKPHGFAFRSISREKDGILPNPSGPTFSK